MQSSTHGGHNPLHAAFYADHAVQSCVSIVENVPLARDTFRVRFDCPQIARRIVPGQFVMMRVAGCNDPLLGRPLAVYDTVLGDDGAPIAIDVVYLTLGKMTRRLASMRPGERLDLWGPLGNGFPPVATNHLILVAGGIGQTPFLALGMEYLGGRRYGDPPRVVPTAKSLTQNRPGEGDSPIFPRGLGKIGTVPDGSGIGSKRITLCYGVRTGALAAGVDEFRAAGFDVRLASDDGTLGHHGLVTDLLGEVIDETRGQDRLVVCCGPEPMMHAVADLCRLNEVRCLASLETPMACGIGICFSCVAKVRQPDGGWDWKRTCVEGPVFDAEKIEW
jgi:dihydroorotate dehydrogenase electron transfer subunit